MMKWSVALLCVALSVTGLAQTEARTPQVDVELKVIALGIQDVEDLARKGPVDGDTLLGLWQEGRGQLLAAPRATIVSGAEAIVQAVVEYIYPTAFASVRAGTNETAVAVGLVDPSDFERRDVGLIMPVLAEVDPEGRIALTLRPERCRESEWRDYGRRARLPNGTEVQTPMELPFFRSESAETRLVVAPGATVLVGGGVPSEDGKDFLYMFVTANLVDTNGKPLPTE